MGCAGEHNLIPPNINASDLCSVEHWEKGEQLLEYKLFKNPFEIQAETIYV